jgi:uncharacterized protein (DUF169 family)
MDERVKSRFLDVWERYFTGAELPLGWFYTDDPGRGDPPAPGKSARCVVSALRAAREGAPLAFSAETTLCFGGKRYFGFDTRLRPDLEYFLSCGIPGMFEGERYKKSPEIAAEFLRRNPPFEAPGRFIVFKRWDTLDAADEPAAVVFFAAPDVLSGLFTLANFDEGGLHGVIAPMGSGCASIVGTPLAESLSAGPRAVLGMFDVSARPCVGPNELTFTIPWARFLRMLANAEESFLITGSWESVRARIAAGR